MSQSQEFCRSFSPQPMQAYRYVTKTPRNLRLSLNELLTYVPPAWIRAGYSNQSATVELLCTDILQSHIPRISVDQLKKVIPHVLRIPADVHPATKVLLPTTRVALAYQLVTESSPDGQHPPDGPLPPDGAQLSSPELEESPAAGPQTAKASSPPATQRMKLPVRRGLRVLLWMQKKIGWGRTDQAKKDSPSDFSSSFPEESQESGHTSDDQNSEDPVFPKEGAAKPEFFASLPLLIPRPIPPPSQSVPVTAITTPAPPPKENPKSVDLSYPTCSFPPFTNSDTTDQQTAVLDKKHLITPLSQPLEFLSNESHLQTLLHTDERLSIHRVLDLCSQLPGIRDCILAQSWEVVARSQQLGSLDPMRAGSQASGLIDNIREASTKMGLGTVKAITLYSSEGPISFLRDQDLCFMIRHSDQERGFVPGVREKLQLILSELNKSKILVPPQALPPKTESIAGTTGHDKF